MRSVRACPQPPSRSTQYARIRSQPYPLPAPPAAGASLATPTHAPTPLPLPPPVLLPPAALDAASGASTSASSEALAPHATASLGEPHATPSRDHSSQGRGVARDASVWLTPLPPKPVGGRVQPCVQPQAATAAAAVLGIDERIAAVERCELLGIPADFATNWLNARECSALSSGAEAHGGTGSAHLAAAGAERVWAWQKAQLAHAVPQPFQWAASSALLS